MSIILEQLDKILLNLKNAQEKGDQKLITKYLEDMNQLWEDNKEEMRENAKKDGFKLDDI